MPTPEPLAAEGISVGRIVTRTELLQPLPMLGKDLLEALPADKDCGRHGSTSRWGVGVS